MKGKHYHCTTRNLFFFLSRKESELSSMHAFIRSFIHSFCPWLWMWLAALNPDLDFLAVMDWDFTFQMSHFFLTDTLQGGVPIIFICMCDCCCSNSVTSSVAEELRGQNSGHLLPPIKVLKCLLEWRISGAGSPEIKDIDLSWKSMPSSFAILWQKRKHRYDLRLPYSCFKSWGELCF